MVDCGWTGKMCVFVPIEYFKNFFPFLFRQNLRTITQKFMWPNMDMGIIQEEEFMKDLVVMLMIFVEEIIQSHFSLNWNLFLEIGRIYRRIRF